MPADPSVVAPSTAATVRSAIVANALWGVEHRGKIGYSMHRPIPAVHRPRHLPLVTDCSGFITLCYSWAHAPDPNGNGYSGQGSTATMLTHCRRIPLLAAKPGDILVFDDGKGGEHGCIVVQHGANPMLVSHGSARGPGEVDFATERLYHRGTRPVWLTLLTPV